MLGITNSSNAPSVVLKDTVVSTWTALPSTGTDSDMKTQGYTYYSSMPAVGVTENTIAEITFSDAQAKSGNYAPVCRTFTDAIRIYSKVNTSITIPSIIIHSIVENYYEVDNSAPTSGKTTAITSGAVYNAIGGDRGTDMNPIKFVDGVATPVTDPLIKNTATNIPLTGITVGTGAQSIKNETIAVAGWYLINVVVESSGVVNTGGYLLGIAKNVNDGWGQVVHLTTADNLRISLTRVLYFNANDKVYVNLYNGGGTNITVSGRELSIVRLN